MAATETTLLCGPGENLVATFTLPAGATDARGLPVALLTNSGVISRAGPHRLNVHLARRLAQRGIASVRFDLSGIGDSRRAGSSLGQIEQWVLDTRAIMDTASQRLRAESFFMVGFCSGAEVAYRCALAEQRLVGVLLWDLYAYPTWRSQLNVLLFRLRRAGVAGLASKLLRKLRMRGEASGAAQKQLQDLEPARVPTKEEFGAGLKRLVDRGASVHVMFCGGEPHWYNYPTQFNDSMRGLPGLEKVSCEQLAISDHLLTRAVARDAFLESVDRWLEASVLVGHACTKSSAPAQAR